MSIELHFCNNMAYDVCFILFFKTVVIRSSNKNNNKWINILKSNQIKLYFFSHRHMSSFFIVETIWFTAVSAH